MKKYYFYALTALALASCSSDDYLGGHKAEVEGEVPISFGSKTAAVTRATGTAAATALGNSFVVYGFKTTGSPATTQTIYDHYTVNYVDGTANTTESNTAGWEYVNQTLNMLTSLDKAGGAEQSIKYWDFAATQYDFVAFSIGEQTSANKLTQVAADATPTDNQVAISKVTTTSGPTFTIKGKLADIAKVYVADRVTAKNTVDGDLNASATGRQVAYKSAVQFNFHSAVAKVRIGLFETIPGYSVKGVKFYNNAGIIADANQAPTLYASAAQKIANPTGVVTATVTYPVTDQTSVNYNKASVTIPDADKTQNLTFGNITLKAAEHKEATGNVYLGRLSEQASLCEYVSVFPCSPGALTLKVDYTLLARDGSGEEIKVVGATATVPAEYANWKPNYAYTYLFKISDNTNGEIGGEVGLYPITLDAVVAETEDGVQETITTVATPSITTYAKGVNPTVAATAEYPTGMNIYVSLENPGTATLTTANTALFTAVVEGGAAQGITEESVANAIKYGALVVADGDLTATHACVATPTAPQIAAGVDVSSYYKKNADGNYFKCGSTETSVEGTTYYDLDPTKATGYVVKDANGKKLTVTVATAPTIVTEIDAADAPDGNAISGNFAMFNADSDGTYVFEYTDGSSNKHYKVIKVVAAPVAP